MKKPVDNEIDESFVKCKGTTPIFRRDPVILWDYKKYSEAKKIERIAMFFPQTGRDKESVEKLYKIINLLKIPTANKKLIEFYHKLIEKEELF